MSDLFSAPTLGIDLGASFTKVSYRPGWKDGKRYEVPSRLLIIEGSPLIPSLAIFNGKRGNWMLGKAAAELTPGSDDQVFENWKAAIFSKELNVSVDGALDAAGQFFEWLKSKIEDCDVPVKECRVNICLPAFEDINVPAEILARRMSRYGWSDVSMTRITEPRANTLGVFGEGRNVLYRRYPHIEPNPIFRDIFSTGGPFFDHLYRHTMVGGDRLVSLALVDIGSFTTDISIVAIDAQGDGDCVNSLLQRSFALGLIKCFEIPMMAELGRRYRFKPSDLSLLDRERIKAALALAGQHSFATFDGTTVTVGQKADHDLAMKLAKDFASDVLKTLLSVKESASIGLALFTGGGMAAKVVRDAINAVLDGSGIRAYPVVGYDSVGDEANFNLRRWPDSGEPLVRIATALGASGVLLDFPASNRPLGARQESAVVSPYVVCLCRGGNKGCMRCNGAGQYLSEAQ